MPVGKLESAFGNNAYIRVTGKVLVLFVFGVLYITIAKLNIS